MSGSRRARDEAFGVSDEEEDTKYGFRRSRREVSYEYRSSSALWPAQIMEREVYYTVATDLLQRSSIIAGILALLSLWISMESRKDAIVASAREKIQ